MKSRSEAQKERWKKRPEEVEKQREFMKNGWSDYMNSNNHTKELRARHSKYMLEKWQDSNSKYNSKEYKEIKRQQLLSGQGVWMHQFLKNPSKPQLKIFKMVQKICPYVFLNYPIYGEKNCSIDIAIPKLNLAIEYDGFHYHEDTFGNPSYDLERERILKEDGWVLIKYKGLKNRDIVPSFEQLKQDIMEVLNHESIK
jgi:hypothetical protein